MSVHVMSWVLKKSDATLGARLVLLVLADHAKDDGTSSWPSVDTICREARMSRRAVQDALRRLEADGAIRSVGVHRTGTTVYHVLMERGGADSAQAQMSARDATDSAPEPSVNHPLPVSRAPAHKRAPLRYGGKAVPDALATKAHFCLDVFNVVGGRNLTHWRADGRPSQHLREIVGCMLERPDVTPEQWEAAIKNTFANPPRWVTDEGRELQIGDVFGKRAADHALSNGGVPRPAGGRGRASASELLRKLGDD